MTLQHRALRYTPRTLLTLRLPLSVRSGAVGCHFGRLRRTAPTNHSSKSISVLSPILILCALPRKEVSFPTTESFNTIEYSSE